MLLFNTNETTIFINLNSLYRFIVFTERLFYVFVDIVFIHYIIALLYIKIYHLIKKMIMIFEFALFGFVQSSNSSESLLYLLSGLYFKVNNSFVLTWLIL